MFAMGRDQHMVSRLHLHGLAIIEHQFRFAFQYDYPLVFVLIVPEAFRTGMAGGDDSFNADMLVLDEDRDKFFGKVGRKKVEQVTHCALCQFENRFLAFVVAIISR